MAARVSVGAAKIGSGAIMVTGLAEVSQNEDGGMNTAIGLVVADRADTLDLYQLDLAPHDRDRVDDYVARASAAATLRAYQSDWRLFCAWCA